MAVPLSKVKTICTGSELALVRASRKPQLEKLSLAETRKFAALARKSFDKWQDQSRAQARTRSRQVGFGEIDNRTQLKVRIFQEALRDFEKRVSQLERSESKIAHKSSAGAPKKVRASEHRATRAAVRAQLTEKEIALNAKADARKKRSSKPKPATAAPATKAMAIKPSPDAKRKKAQPPKKPASAAAQQRLSAQPSDRLTVAAAAKQSRVERSGLTTRLRGHRSASVRRAQGRRDAGSRR